jgi:cell division protein FtsL
LVLGGIQILSFGFVAIQIVSLRREILRVQKENLELKKGISEKLFSLSNTAADPKVDNQKNPDEASKNYY